MGKSRRDVLESVGGSVLGIAGLSGISGASSTRSRERLKHLLEVANTIRNKRGQEARAKFLRTHDLPTTYTTINATLPGVGNGSDEVSTEHWTCVDPSNCDDPSMQTSISLTVLWGGGYYVELSMRYRYHLTWNDYLGPASPTDGFGFMWQEDRWKVEDRRDIPSCVSTSNNVRWENGSWSPEAIGFTSASKQACLDDNDWGDDNWTDYLYGGVYMERGPDHDSNDPIYAEYEYVWADTDPDVGVSVGYPPSIGVTVTSDTHIHTEDFQTDPDGNTLLVTTSDAHL